MSDDVAYLLYWDDDAIPVVGNMTLGNHLDNDLMVAGEDVFDYHARVDLSPRGPVLIPLGEATINVNGHETGSPVQLMLGDVLGIGQATMQVGIELEQAPEADEWALHGIDQSVYPLAGELTVGRADSNDICLGDEHISRFHARLVEKSGVVWLQDLRSANGSSVNGVPVQGGVRLFHGDRIGFDKIEFQLIGRGGDLTPVLQTSEPLRGTRVEAPSPAPEPTQFTGSEEFVSTTVAQMPQLSETGAFLLGISESVDGKVFRVGVGETLIGRAAHCQIKLDDATVSVEHARIQVRPEGVIITNLMSTNGIQVNAEQVASVRLNDGDVVRLGKVALMFKDVPPTSIDAYPLLRNLSTWIPIGAVLLALLLLWLIWF